MSLLSINFLQNYFSISRNLRTIFPLNWHLTKESFLPYIAAFQRVQGDTFNNRYEDIETMLVKGLNNRWFNTIMSTLYMMEEDLMEMSSDSVFTLWDIFFTCQALRKENNVVAMGLNTFELKRQ